jgi:hypothetical protein
VLLYRIETPEISESGELAWAVAHGGSSRCRDGGTGGSAVTDELVLIDIKDGVATITLNRPNARNALNGAI